MLQLLSDLQSILTCNLTGTYNSSGLTPQSFSMLNFQFKHNFVFKMAVELMLKYSLGPLNKISVTLYH